MAPRFLLRTACDHCSKICRISDSSAVMPGALSVMDASLVTRYIERLRGCVKSSTKGGRFVTSRLQVLMDDAYAFMLTDSCCFSAFSSRLARAARLRSARSFRKLLALT